MKSYKGPFATIGFRYSQPVDKTLFAILIKDDFDTLKDDTISILNKYDIPFEEVNVTKDVHNGYDALNIVFKSYSDYESNSIINSLLDNLYDKKYDFVPDSINLYSDKPHIKKPIGFGRS